MLAGRLSERITLERAAVVTDDYGGETPAWANIAGGTVWAEVRYGTGQERRTAAQESASAPATFMVRRSAMTAALSEKDRILFREESWDIQSIVPLKREGFEITAVRSDQPTGG